MTQMRNFTVTTILIPRGDNPRLSISCDFTGLGTSIPKREDLRLQIGQAIEQWWNGLTRFQRFALADPSPSLKISASFPTSQES